MNECLHWLVPDHWSLAVYFSPHHFVSKWREKNTKMLIALSCHFTRTIPFFSLLNSIRVCISFSGKRIEHISWCEYIIITFILPQRRIAAPSPSSYAATLYIILIIRHAQFWITFFLLILLVLLMPAFCLCVSCKPLSALNTVLLLLLFVLMRFFLLEYYISWARALYGKQWLCSQWTRTKCLSWAFCFEHSNPPSRNNSIMFYKNKIKNSIIAPHNAQLHIYAMLNTARPGRMLFNVSRIIIIVIQAAAFIQMNCI